MHFMTYYNYHYVASLLLLLSLSLLLLLLLLLLYSLVHFQKCYGHPPNLLLHYNHCQDNGIWSAGKVIALYTVVRGSTALSSNTKDFRNSTYCFPD